MKSNKGKMSYGDRLRHYEAEKRQLWSTDMSGQDYEQALKKLAQKWEI